MDNVTHCQGATTEKRFLQSAPSDGRRLSSVSGGINMNSRAIFILAGASALAFATLDSASALQTNPKCQYMDNPIGCTCALQYGGTVGWDQTHMWWTLPTHDQAKYAKCLKVNGGTK